MEQDHKQATAAFWKSYFNKMRRPVAGGAAAAVPDATTAVEDAPAPALDVPATRRMRRQRSSLASRALTPGMR